MLFTHVIFFLLLYHAKLLDGNTCIYHRNVMVGLDLRIFIGISKESNSYVLLTSNGD
jgi:hypothetical protein